MSPPAIKCPPRSALRDYASGRLSEIDSSSIFEHICDCTHCADELETIHDIDDSMIANLRSLDPFARFAQEPNCEIAVAKAMGALTGTSEVPRSIGEYEIIRPLGRGGMGSVYLARHSKLGRKVALKVLATHRLTDPRMRQRFGTEMHALGQLSHPNIVTAHDAREVDGTAVLVTEFVDGCDLGELIRRTGKLPIADACEIARLVAVALAYIESKGFVHRDVKPANIMLSRSGAVKLLDLGLARFQDGAPDGVEMTGSGQVMGTADYIAPEQVTDSRNVDIRTDIYALGCTLMKLLTQRAPFADDQHVSPFSKMTAHVSTAPPRLKQLLPDAPEKLELLVDSMLQKEPRKRPQTPGEVAERLAEFTLGNDLRSLGQAQLADMPAASAMTKIKPLRRWHVPLWVAVATGVLGFVGGVLLGMMITIETPDGKIIRFDVPRGSGVTFGEPPTQMPVAPAANSRTAVGPLIEIGNGTIPANDPFAFVVLLNPDEVSETDLQASRELMGRLISNDAENAKIVATGLGIWIELTDGLAAPIVHQYNGARYALASGAPEARITWDDLSGHLEFAQSSYDARQKCDVIELEFDAPLAAKMQQLTGQHLRHRLAVVARGTIRTTPEIFTEIRGEAKISGKFSNEEIRFLMENIQGGLINPIK